MAVMDDFGDFDIESVPDGEAHRIRSALPQLDIFDHADFRSALFKATAAVHRLETFCNDPVAARVTSAWSRRREAIAIAAAADRVKVFEESVAAMGGETLVDISSKGDRLAADILEASQSTEDMHGDRLGEAEIRAIWETADQSNLKLSSGDSAWRLERDCAETASEFASLMKNPTPWTAAEAIRTAWTGDRFDGLGRRMALILANPVLRSGFGVRHYAGGIADEIAKEAERIGDISLSPDDFLVLACRGVERSATSAREAGQRLMRLMQEFTALCGPQREGRSRTGLAIEAILSTPILTPQALRVRLGTSDRGAEFILNKLLSVGCITEHETSTRRNRTFVCRKALNLAV